jgi:hypothetical protein
VTLDGIVRDAAGFVVGARFADGFKAVIPSEARNLLPADEREILRFAQADTPF